EEAEGRGGGEIAGGEEEACAFPPDDPRWLHSLPEEQLREFCFNAGLETAGGHRELFERLVELQELYEEEGDGEEDEVFAQEEFDRVLRSARERYEKGKAVDCDGDSSGDNSEAERRQQAFAARRRQKGSLRNEMLRRGLDWSRRVCEAEKLKCEANTAFGEGTEEATERALAAYLAAIWLLKPDDPPCPNSLCAGIWALRPGDPLRPVHLQEFAYSLEAFECVRLLGEGSATPCVDDLPRLDDMVEKSGTASCDARGKVLREGVKAIGVGSRNAEQKEWAVEWFRWASTQSELHDLHPEKGMELGKRTIDLRLTLHLNVAAAALRFNDHTAAKAACEFVLKRKPEHPKALYRSATAHAGNGDFNLAQATLRRLLSLPEQKGNKEARKLMLTIRDQAP
ncbi:MAG: hypothetical protein SGPRY_013431, partial [Prymnesium sp.]